MDTINCVFIRTESPPKEFLWTKKQPKTSVRTLRLKMDMRLQADLTFHPPLWKGHMVWSIWVQLYILPLTIKSPKPSFLQFLVLRGPQNPLELLFLPQSWMWNMYPSKIGFLSIRVVFHFHGYGRKAKLNLLPFVKGKGFHSLILEGEVGVDWHGEFRVRMAT